MKYGQKGKSKGRWLVAYSFPPHLSILSCFLLPFPISLSWLFLLLCSLFICIFFFLHFFCLLRASKSEDFSYNGKFLFFFNFHQQGKFLLHFFFFILCKFSPFLCWNVKICLVSHIFVVKTIFVLVVWLSSFFFLNLVACLNLLLGLVVGLFGACAPHFSFKKWHLWVKKLVVVVL